MNRKDKLKVNIWKFYLYRFFCCLTFITPIFTLFYLENGLNMTEVMVLQSVYTIVSLIVVVPAGIIADYIGRKKVLLTNSFFFTLGWAIFASSYTFNDFLIAEIIIGISSGMWMAVGTAFFYDNLRELKQTSKFKSLFGNALAIQYGTWAFVSVIGAYIATFSLRINFWLTAIFTGIGFLIVFSFTDTKKYKHGDKHYFLHLKQAVKFASTHKKVRYFIIYYTLMYVTIFSSLFLFQPYLKSINIPLIYFGAVYFAMNGLGAFGSKTAHYIEKKLGERKTLLLLLSMYLISVIGMAFQFNIFGAVFPILLFFGSGIFDTVITDYINKHTDSHHRATVMSLNTFVSLILASIIAPIIGYVVDVYSLSHAFILLSSIMFLNFILLQVKFNIFNVLCKK